MPRVDTPPDPPNDPSPVTAPEVATDSPAEPPADNPSDGAAAPPPQLTALPLWAMQMFSLILRRSEGLSARELADHTGQPLDHITSLTQALTRQKYLRFNAATGRYQHGYVLVGALKDALKSDELVRLCLPELEWLRNLCGESAFASIDAGEVTMMIAREECSHAERHVVETGNQFPFHCSAAGLAILAFQSEARIDRHLQGPLRKVTVKTVNDPTELRRQLSQIRNEGYSVVDETVTLGQRGIAVPVFDRHGQAAAALAYSGPLHRITEQRLPYLAEALQEAASRISQRLRTRANAPKPLPPVQPLSPPGTSFTLAPQWDPQEGRFLWYDPGAQALQVALLAGEVRTGHDIAEGIDAVVRSSNGQILLIAGQRLIDLASGGALKLDSSMRCTVSGARGEIWAVVDRNGQDLLVRVREDGSTEPLTRFAERASCLVHCPRGRMIYIGFANSGTIGAYSLTSRRYSLLRSFARASGRPTALAVDRDRNLWIGLADSWMLMQLSPDGLVRASYNLPVAYPTGLIFGGDAGRDLVITSDARSLPAQTLQHAPLNGGAFRVQFDP